MYCLRGMAIGEEETEIPQDDEIEIDPLLATFISIFLVLDVAVLVIIIVVLVKKRRSGKDVGA
jgi:hypothetical protein